MEHVLSICHADSTTNTSTKHQILFRFYGLSMQILTFLVESLQELGSGFCQPTVHLEDLEILP